MLSVRICTIDGTVIAEGTCSDSGYFLPALAGIYNAGLNLVPPRGVESFGGGAASADYPVGTRRATFGYTPRGGGSHRGVSERLLDDEVIVHVERT